MRHDRMWRSRPESGKSNRLPNYRSDAQNPTSRTGRHRVLEQAESQRRMIFKLSDGTEVEYHVPTPADAAATVTATFDDVTMFSSMIRLAVLNPDAILAHIGTLPDPVVQTTLLGTEIVLAALQAQARLWRSSK